jgi:hypothetical protein
LKRLTATLTFVISLAALLAAQSLIARIDGDQLHITAPRLHFLAGDALTRLRDGTTVKYELQLTARTDRTGRVLARSLEQFGISYDLWEEKFAVTRLGSTPKSISHLSAAAAEAWCVDNTTLPVATLNGNQAFWIRLDYRTEDSTTSSDPQDNSGFTLSTLVDIFSRRTRNEQLHGSEEVGPLRLENLKKR